MTIYIDVPGQHRGPIIVPDNATLQEFAQRAFEQTGLNIFNGFGYSGKNNLTVELSSSVNKESPYDETSLATVSLDKAANTALSTLLSHGDEVIFVNTLSKPL